MLLQRLAWYARRLLQCGGSRRGGGVCGQVLHFTCPSSTNVQKLTQKPGGSVRNGVESFSLDFAAQAHSFAAQGGAPRGSNYGTFNKSNYKAVFGYRVVPPSAPCPADLGGYALLCGVLLCGALVAASLPPGVRSLLALLVQKYKS